MFSIVCVHLSIDRGEGVHVAITYDALSLTIEGLSPGSATPRLPDMELYFTSLQQPRRQIPLDADQWRI